MNQECKIKDDNEILEDEKNRFNFRRFKPEELEKKYSPFDRTQKKDFPFLFQKKRSMSKDDEKISLEDIMNKVKDLSFKSPSISICSDIAIPEIELDELEANTPPYPPNPDETNLLFDIS